jgi:hypothetical protein
MGTLREALAAAVSKHEIDVPGDETADEVAEEVEAAPEQDVEPVETEQPAEEPVEPAEEELQAQDGRQRDEHGRFKPKPQGEQPPAAEAQRQPQAQRPAAEQPPAQPVVPPTALKAPSSWKPEAREAFARAPVEVQQEITRIDREVRQVMQQAAQSHNFVQAFMRTVQPYEAMIRGDQRGRPYNPIAAIDSLLGTAAVLRTGSPIQKADLVAEIVESYGVTIEDLDRALTKKLGGKPAEGQPDQRPQQPYHDPRVDELLAQREQDARARHDENMRRGQADVDAFGQKPGNDFFNDVRRDMAALMEAATNAGEPMTLQEAYDTALLLPKHKGIQKILSQREAAKKIEEKKKAALKARNTASSVRGSPTGGAKAAPGESRRGDIEDAFEQHAEAR